MSSAATACAWPCETDRSRHADDCGDGVVNITDVTALINYVLTH